MMASKLRLKDARPNLKLARRMLASMSYLILAALLVTTPVQAGDGFSPYVDADGNITLPENFRVDMVHLGSWFVPEGGASGLHDVYTESASVKAFLETGKFPDGATLVKEVRGSEADDYTTAKNVSRATEVKQWFVMIKDAKGRFPDNPHWGYGWGWALYKPDQPSKNVSTGLVDACLTCHVPAQKTDWVFVEGYPTLRSP